MVRGLVRYRGGAPISNVLVRIYDINLNRNNDKLLGQTSTNGSGNFRVEFNLDDFDWTNKQLPDIQVKVFDPADLNDPIGVSEIHYGANTDEKIRVIVDTNNENIWSEFEQINEEIISLLSGQGLHIHELVENDVTQHITYIVGHTHIKRRKVRAFIQAHKLWRKTKEASNEIEAAFFYGLIRGGLPSDLEGLLMQSSHAIKKAINDAIKKIWIPWTIREQINTYLVRFNVIRVLVSLGDLGRDSLIDEIIALEIPNKDEREHFYIKYFELVYADSASTEQDDINVEEALEQFWNVVKNDPLLQQYYENLISTLKIATIVGGDLKLTKVLRDEREAGSHEDLGFIGKKIKNDWIVILQQSHTADTDFPNGVEGEDLASKINDYTESIYVAVEKAIPNLVLRERLFHSGKLQQKTEDFMSGVRDDSIAFDFISTSIAIQVEDVITNHLGGLQNDKDDISDELKIIQRLYRITRKYDALEILKDDDIYSAFDVIKFGRQWFLDKYTAKLQGIISAETVYQNAHYITSTALTVYGQVSPAFNQEQMQVIGDVSQPKDVANWPSLFSSPDYCECAECESVLSPSAYLVELLNFLQARKTDDDKSVLNILLARRPDIELLQLNCVNSNKTLPYIDIVLEVLENQVSLFELEFDDPELKADFSQSVPSAAIKSEFKTKSSIDISSDAYIEETTQSNTWHISDIGVRYKVHYDEQTDKLAVISRGFQSIEDAEENPIGSENVNVDVYSQLKSQKRPWSLPYNIWLDNARAILKQINLPLWQLKRAFSVSDKIDELHRDEMIQELLSLETVDEIGFLKDDESDIDNYYSTPISGSLDNRKLPFVLESGSVKYEEFVELSKTWFLSFTIIGGNSCSVVDLSLSTFNKRDAQKFHIFTRLWKRLGWTISELDFALDVCTRHQNNQNPVFGDIIGDYSKDIQRLAYINHLTRLLGLSVNEVLSLWGGLQTHGDKSHYSQLFKPLSVKNTDLELIDGALRDSSKKIDDNIFYLQGAFNARAQDIQSIKSILVDDTIKISNLAVIYAVTLLANRFDIDASDVILLKVLTQLDAFNVDKPDETILFIETLEKIAFSDISIKEISYLVRTDENTKKIVEPPANKIAMFLNKLRNGLAKINSEYQIKTNDQGDEVIDESGEELRKKLSLLEWPVGSVDIILPILLGQGHNEVSFDNNANIKINIDGLLHDETTQVLIREGLLTPSERDVLKANSPNAEVTAAIDKLYNNQITDTKPYLSAWPSRKVEVTLDALPPNIMFPNEFINRLNFNQNNMKLSWVGIFTASDKVKLLNLKNGDVNYDNSIDQLIAAIETISATDRMFADAEIGELFKINSIKQRLLFVMNKLYPHLEYLATDNYLINMIDAEFELGEDYIERLLNTALCANNIFIGEAFKDNSFIMSTHDITENDLAFKNVWFAYRRLYKTKLLTEHFSWGRNAKQWSITDLSGDVKKAFVNSFPLELLNNDKNKLNTYLAVLNLGNITRRYPELSSNKETIYEIILNSIVDVTIDSAKYSQHIAESLGFDKDDIKLILTNHKVQLPNDEADTILSDRKAFTHPVGLARALECAVIIHRLGSNYGNTIKIVGDVGRDDAFLMRDLVRAKYGDTDWQDAGKQIFDEIRKRQRNALSTYLIEHNSAYKDKNDLDEALLIGVQMGSCMETSRVVQAFISVQRFIHRCFLNREENITVDVQKDSGWKEWGILQNYRVWDAKRKVYMMPHNWIVPEYRDDKSAFYKDLESELLQNETNQEVAEDAFRHYLEKLAEVANLEVVAFYRDKRTGKGADKDCLYVFARTRGVPSIYYFRKRLGGVRWTPWERIDLDIEGDHLIPVVWNRRIYLFWPVFTEKQIPSFDSNSPPAIYWSIQMAWSEYYRNKWSAKKVTKEKMQSAHGPGSVERNTTKALHAFQSEIYSGELRIKWCAYELGQMIKTEYQGEKDYYWQPTDVIKSGSFNFTGYGNRVYTSVPLMMTPNAHKLYLRKLTGITYEGNDLVESDSGATFLPTQLNVHSDGIILKTTPGSVPYRWVTDNQNKGFSFNMPYFYDDDRYSYFVEPKSLRKDRNIRNVDSLDINRLSLRIVDLARSTLYKSTYNDVAYNISESGGAWASEYISAENENNIPQAVDTQNPFAYLKNESSSSLTTTVGSNLPFEGRASTGASHISNLIAYRKPAVMLGYSYEMDYLFYQNDLPLINNYIKTLANNGIDGFLDTALQEVKEEYFSLRYNPTSHVVEPYPIRNVDFNYIGSYSLYNWELFFHIPLQIAVQLSQNQQFEQARQWFHYIFDPTVNSGDEAPQKYWKCLPLKEAADADLQAEKLSEIIEKIQAGEIDKVLNYQIRDWQENPFNPHAIARMRLITYQKTVVMKYLDNLIAWADREFRSDRREAIERAAVLYNEAADILGPRPNIVKHSNDPKPLTYSTLTEERSRYGEALKELELFIDIPGDMDAINPANDEENQLARSSMLYFCIPHNKKLLDYWDMIGDRQFKINNCQNIEGVARPLRLLDPPIDPALLVRAAAAGIDLNTVLSDMFAPRPYYRFESMIQFARGLANNLAQLGSKFLSAYEKKDAESLSLLRSSQEIELQKKVKEIFKERINESKESLKGLEESKKTIEIRRDYYQSRKKVSLKEQRQMDKLDSANNYSQLASGVQVAASLAYVIPEIGASFNPYTEIGGKNFGRAVEAASGLLRLRSTYLSHEASMYSIKSGHDRRWDEWKHQENTANQELKQIEKQIAAAKIRSAISEYERSNHEQQMEDSQAAYELLKSKFTNKELYDWMVSELSKLYFQSYQLAYDVAKQTEKAFQHDLAEWNNSFIQFGYWDSLRKGLLSGERLLNDLDALEASYRSKNKRYDEHEKTVSLAMLDPMALMQLKTKGECFFDLTETLFDMDHCGQFMRRIKLVSITIPCVTGPFQNVNSKLTLLRDSIRISDQLVDAKYERQGIDDPRFKDNVSCVEHIRTSRAQNDTGQFELNYRDERLLKFEGAGVYSRWRLDLPFENNNFDYETISDVMLTIRYTAREGGADFQNEAKKTLQLRQAIKLLSMKHHFNDIWQKLINDSSQVEHITMIPLTTENLWHGQQHTVKKLKTISFLVSSKTQADSIDIVISSNIDTYDSTVPATYEELKLQELPTKYPGIKLGVWDEESDPGERWMMLIKPKDNTAKILDLDDIVMVIEYELQTN